MPKNKGKGGKNRRRGKNDAFNEKREIIYKEDLQEYAQIIKMLGGGRVEAKCFDGKQRICRIRGTMKKRVWVNCGDIVLVSLREYEDDKGDIVHKYYPSEARTLVQYGEIPDTVDLSNTGSGVNEFEEEEDGFQIDFDPFGYRRDPETYRRIRSTGVLHFDDEDREYHESLDAEGLGTGPTH